MASHPPPLGVSSLAGSACPASGPLAPPSTPFPLSAHPVPRFLCISHTEQFEFSLILLVSPSPAQSLTFPIPNTLSKCFTTQSGSLPGRRYVLPAARVPSQYKPAALFSFILNNAFLGPPSPPITCPTSSETPGGASHPLLVLTSHSPSVICSHGHPETAPCKVSFHLPNPVTLVTDRVGDERLLNLVCPVPPRPSPRPQVFLLQGPCCTHLGVRTRPFIGHPPPSHSAPSSQPSHPLQQLSSERPRSLCVSLSP